MTDPTPTRAEVTDERLIERLRDMGIQCCDLAADRIPSLRERAEAAEKERDNYQALYEMGLFLLTDAYAAEATAWETCAQHVDAGIYMGSDGEGTAKTKPMTGDYLRALRRAAPTEGEA